MISKPHSELFAVVRDALLHGGAQFNIGTADNALNDLEEQYEGVLRQLSEGRQSEATLRAEVVDSHREIAGLKEQLEALRNALAQVSSPASEPTTKDMVGLAPDIAGDLSAVEHQRRMRGTSNQEKSPS